MKACGICIGNVTNFASSLSKTSFRHYLSKVAGIFPSSFARNGPQTQFRKIRHKIRKATQIRTNFRKRTFHEILLTCRFYARYFSCMPLAWRVISLRHHPILKMDCTNQVVSLLTFLLHQTGSTSQNHMARNYANWEKPNCQFCDRKSYTAITGFKACREYRKASEYVLKFIVKLHEKILVLIQASSSSYSRI